MGKAAKSGTAPAQKAAPDSAPQAAYFIDPSVLAALLARASGPDAENLSFLPVERTGENSEARLASVPGDGNFITDLLAGATLDFVDGSSAGRGNADGLGCDHGSLMVIGGSSGIPFLPLFFDGAMPAPVPIDQQILERIDCLMPELMGDLSGIFATTDEPDSLLLLVLPPIRDLPPPSEVTEFG